jgi:hypothetical protein
VLALPLLVAAEPAGFAHRGFYLHGSWVMNYPFAVRTWQQDDFAHMFRLLGGLGFDTVMVWPTMECAPMPLSKEDARELARYRRVIDDAHRAGLACWITTCPLVVAREGIRATPWKRRSLYAWMETVKLSDPVAGPAYLAHRKALLRQFRTADALVVIDGDPGGYPGSPVEEYVRLLEADRRALPGKPVIPWLWSGWGRDTAAGGFWKAPVEPGIRATLEALRVSPGAPWPLMPGRSHREGWANGRTPIALTERAGMMGQATLMCYEAIEFEPTPPAGVLQFDLIRQALRQEGASAGVARGVFGNAQQPVMVLPNLYFFARAAADLRYLDRPDTEVLADFAQALGGDPAVLVPAWRCLQLPLEELPAELPERLRRLKLGKALAGEIPGGPRSYVRILAAQVESRRELLAATAEAPTTAEEAATNLSRGAAALIGWWRVHRYVGPGEATDPFAWRFLHPSQVSLLRSYARLCAGVGGVEPAARKLAAGGLLTETEARARLAELTR